MKLERIKDIKVGDILRQEYDNKTYDYKVQSINLLPSFYLKIKFVESTDKQAKGLLGCVYTVGNVSFYELVKRRNTHPLTSIFK